VARLAFRIARAAAPIVPADIRADWRREWEAELHFAGSRGVRPARLALRALGAWPHACWLRYDRWRWEMLWHDLKYAARTLITRPGFAVVAVLSLAIGIGANAAIFSAVRAVLLRPLPFPDPDAIVTISTTTADRPNQAWGASAPSDFVDWRRDLRSFSEMAAINADAMALTGDGPAEQVPSASVTGGFFAVLGVPARSGRTLIPDDDPVGAPDVAVLSHELWTRRFGQRPSIVGETIEIDSQPFRVVGVMPEGFSYPLGTELWIPERFSEEELRTQRGARYLDVIARLRGGTALSAAERELVAYAGRLAELYPRTNADRTVNLYVMRDALIGDIRPAMLTLLGAVGFVLLIVCVNVASLVLARAVGRQRELAVRTALGAGRGRLVRGLLVESALLAGIGGAAGLVAAIWAARAIAGLDEGIGVPLLDQTRVDGVVALFTVGVAALAAILFGTLPAWHTSARLDIARGIREESGTTTGDRQRHRLRGGLIVVETALAVVLLVGAGLLMRSFISLSSVELGFNAERLQTFNVSLPDSAYTTPIARSTVVDTFLARVATHPGMESAGAIFGLPLSNFRYAITMNTLDGRVLNDDEQTERLMQVRVVTPDYFATMGIPLRRGRALSRSDGQGSPPVVVVNESAASRLWPGEDPLGHEFTLGTRLGQGGSPAGGMVVGVAGDVRDHGPSAAVRPTVYLSHAQFPVSFVTFVIKSRGEPQALIPPLRQALAELDPDLPMFSVRTMEQRVSDGVAQPRLVLTLIGLFAAAAVLLAAVGIYGVMAYNVSQRTREIGLRLALGAERSSVMRMVVKHAMTLALSGLAVGLLLGVLSARLMQSLLFGVEPLDAATYVAVSLGFVVVALLASTIPALRASRLDPIVALRNE
jgi:predicted permease